jgi:RNA polymerase sigma-70 factor (ECF subfamily)
MFWVTDEQAMWRVRAQNDARAFALLVERWRTRIHRLCVRMVGDIHCAEDIAQELFARLYTHRNNYIPQSSFSTYIWRIALNLCHDEIRRRNCKAKPAWRESEGEEISVPSDDPGPDEQIMHSEKVEAVKYALMTLEEHYRQVIILRHYENLKFREIAEVLGVPEGTVKSRMAEGLNKLHAQLHLDWGSLPPSGKAPEVPHLTPNP